MQINGKLHSLTFSFIFSSWTFNTILHVNFCLYFKGFAGKDHQICLQKAFLLLTNNLFIAIKVKLLNLNRTPDKNMLIYKKICQEGTYSFAFFMMPWRYNNHKLNCFPETPEKWPTFPLIR